MVEDNGRESFLVEPRAEEAEAENEADVEHGERAQHDDDLAELFADDIFEDELFEDQMEDEIIGNDMPENDVSDEENAPHEAVWEDVEAHLANLKEQLAPLCVSKAEEMVLWGYEQVEPDAIWELVAEEARKNGALHLHQVANAILTLKPNRFMDHMMKALYRRETL